MAERNFICPKTQEACPTPGVCEPAKTSIDAGEPGSRVLAQLWKNAPEVADAYGSGYCIDERATAVAGVAARAQDTGTYRSAINALTDLDAARAQAQ